MTNSSPICAFAACGIELEYAIVDQHSLAVRPLAADLLRALADSGGDDVVRGQLGWSNELVSHVVELKNISPTPNLEALTISFQREIAAANDALAALSARLLPTGMHPWMNPRHETVLWAGDRDKIVHTYDRIFDCRRHGWSNIQSMHINLPFCDDSEFARLHAAVRLLLPLLPALAASSPLIEGRDAGMLDYRLEAYRLNSKSVPAITGKVIPETVVDRADYERRILAPIYEQLRDNDPAGILRHEWVNARGAIARFDRNAVELRLIDTQECVQADVAIAAATTSVLRAIYAESFSTLWQQQAVPTDTLSKALLDCSRMAEDAVIDDPQLLDALGVKPRRCKAGELWHALLEKSDNESNLGGWWRPRIQAILERGTLARRILRAVDGDFSPEHLQAIYRRLCACLELGQVFS
jgi:gamma-glutamyl:cysteine ligase YbdK (ATP-grasp superfamily)